MTPIQDILDYRTAVAAYLATLDTYIGNLPDAEMIDTGSNPIPNPPPPPGN